VRANWLRRGVELAAVIMVVAGIGMAPVHLQLITTGAIVVIVLQMAERGR